MDSQSLNLHPIQAITITPKELRLSTHVPPNLDLEYDESEFILEVSHSDYFADEKRIQIGARVRLGSENPEVDGEGNIKGIPFFLSVEIVGIFQVDDSRFPVERLIEWATTNAMYIMFPYLREHVYALTSRTGLRPLLLPLLVVPLFKISKEANPTKDQVNAEPQSRHPAQEGSELI